MSTEREAEKAKNYKCLGDTYLRLGEEEKVRESYQSALNLQPSMVEAHRELARHFTLTRQYQSAIESWEKVISLTPLDYQAYFNLAQGYLMVGDKKKAVQALLSCLQVQPDFKPARQLLTHLENRSSGYDRRFGQSCRWWHRCVPPVQPTSNYACAT